MQYKDVHCSDFPGGPAFKNPPANAGDMGSIPGPGRSRLWRGNEACASQLPSWRSRAHVSQLLKPVCPRARAPQQEKSPQQEAWAPQLESSPCLPQLEEVHTQQWRPSAAKKINKNFKKMFISVWLSPFTIHLKLP